MATKIASKKTKYAWEKATDEELLNWRLCDLGLRLENSPLAPAVARLYRELENQGIGFRPHIWLSTEWFCPDGIPGFAIPFYLLHPRLRALEKKHMSFVEGHQKDRLLKLLRHEAGHAIDNAYRLRQSCVRKGAFGNPRKTYPKSYLPQLYSRAYVQHLGEGYAQSHPDEDFAETFAVWLTPRSRWLRRYEDWPALRKLLAMDVIMSSIRGKRARITNRRTSEDLSKMKITLKEYFARKKKEQGHFRFHTLDHDLKKLFPLNSSNRKKTAASFINDHRPRLRRQVATALGQRQYLIDKVISDMIFRAEHLNLKTRSDEPILRHKLERIVLRKAIEYVQEGHHRIIM